MSRKRMLDPGVWTDDGFLHLGMAARVLWFGLISHADDEGRGSADSMALRAKVFPGEGMSHDEIEQLVSEVGAHMRVTFYDVDGARYYQLERWQNHQSIKDKKPSSTPPPRRLPDASPTPPPKEGRKEEKERKEGIDGAERHAYAPHVSMTESEHDALVAKHGADVVTLAIELLDAYKLEKGKHYKSDAGALRSWGIQAALERRDKLRKSGAAPPGVAKFAGRKCAKCGALNTHSGSMCTQCNEDLPRRGA